MRRWRGIFISVALVLAFSAFFGCFRVSPVLHFHEPGKVLLIGDEVGELFNDSLQVKLELCGFEKERWVFSLDVRNNTSSSIQVDPSKFFYRYDLGGVNSGGNLVRAQDPSAELFRIEGILRQATENYKTYNSVEAVLTLLDQIADFSAMEDSKTKTERDLEYLEGIEDEIRKKDEIEMFDKKMYHLEQELIFWEENALHATILQPGQQLHGLVYFPFRRLNSSIEVQLSLVPYIYLQKCNQVSMDVPL